MPLPVSDIFWLTLALFFTVSKIRPLIAWNFPLKIAAKPLQMGHGYYRQPIRSCQRFIRWYHRRPPTTYRLAAILHDWHTVVRYDPSRSSKINDLHVIWKPIYELLMINSNLGPISHRSATLHPWQTTTTHRATDALQHSCSASKNACDAWQLKGYSLSMSVGFFVMDRLENAWS